MTTSQQARFNAYSLALAHLKQHEAIIKEIPGLERAYKMAKSTLEAIEAADRLRQQKQKAVTAGKQQFVEEIAHQALTIASAIVNYATEKKDEELKKAMSFNHSELMYVPVIELGAKVANILSAARPLEAALADFGITPELLSNFAAQAEQFPLKSSQPRSVKAIRKEAGQQIRDGLNQVKEQLDQQIDGLMLQFKFSQPEFYNQYLVKRSLVNPARRKTRVEGVVTDKASQAVLGDVQVTVQDAGITSTTDAEGRFSLGVPPLKGLVVLFQKEGYTTATARVDMKRGKALTQEVSLEKN